MPELPEIETICIGLKNKIIGKKIIYAKNYRKNLRIEFPDNFSEILLNRRITDVKRRAKYILIYMNELILIVHLGMSGRFTHHKEPKEIGKHDHADIILDDNSQLILNDPRRFGLITISNILEIKDHKLFRNLGVEPLSDDLNLIYLINKFKNKKIDIKNSIMDNHIIVGVGNIYASESLFRAGILPKRPTNSLTIIEIKKLTKSIKYTLIDAINSGGSSLKDYVNSAGEKGYFQHKFQVYNRQNLECLHCNSVIEKIKQAGRASFYCKKCQN